MEIELVGVPFDGYGREGNQARAAAVLREAGLLTGLPGGTRDAGDVGLPAFDDRPGVATGLVNEAALEAMTTSLRDSTASAVSAGRFSVVVGGDCSLLLGVVAGLRAIDEQVGVLFVDGHEDTMPIDVSEDGEAANCEIGILLGLTGRLLQGPLGRTRGLLGRDDLCVVGPRDEEWRRGFNVGSVGDLGVWRRPLPDVLEDPARTGREAGARLSARGRWWLHVDLDVLDPEAFPAQGLPEQPDTPGGLDWEQLRSLMTSAVSSPGCIGLSLTIYDPDQDPERTDVARIVSLAHDVVAAATA